DYRVLPVAIRYQVQALHAVELDGRETAAAGQLVQVDPHIVPARRIAPPEVEPWQLGRQLLSIADGYEKYQRRTVELKRDLQCVVARPIADDWEQDRTAATVLVWLKVKLHCALQPLHLRTVQVPATAFKGAARDALLGK